MSDAAAISIADDEHDIWSLPVRLVMAALSAGAGIIHLAMIAPHSQDSSMDGLTMAASGWFQIAIAFAILLRPRRWLLVANIVANAVFLGIWAVSRTSGVPWGSHAGVAEAATAVDQLCAAFEVLMIVGSAALLARPRLGAGLRAPVMALAAGVPALVVVALTTAVLASDAGTHEHDDGHHDEMVEDDGHDHDEMAPPSTLGDDGHGHHEMAPPSTLADDGHDHEH